ncbi:MAG: hypothetical protein KC729_15785, partial [Candidatus Eisenbacteria bacterium]|nr:hypothetical protein [Candidatus Eisenbacteria bacterium]
FYVVDDHRTTLSGFDTRYANRISGSEMRAIEDLYPSVAGYLASGRILTRLQRSFFSGDPMTETLTLVQAANDDEVRTSQSGGFLLGMIGGFPGQLLGLVGLAGALGALRRRR